ncbi:MAG: transcription antitermination factor NusB [Calditrichaceae bacterium]
MKRRAERETALKILYALEINPSEAYEQIDLYKQNFAEEVTNFSVDIIRIAMQKKEELDNLIKSRLQNWDFDRVAVIDKILLRIALTELLFFPDVPAEVTLNEVIEISKTYSTERSGKFINGILDAILKTDLLNKEEEESKK